MTRYVIYLYVLCRLPEKDRVRFYQTKRIQSTSVFFISIETKMPYTRRNAWIWSKPCSCCRQFENDQANKLDTRAKRAARRAAMPRNPPPETIQVTTVPTLPVQTYSNLETVIARMMNTHYGTGYSQVPTHDLYGCMIGHDSYNPWNRSRNWEE